MGTGMWNRGAWTWHACSLACERMVRDSSSRSYARWGVMVSIEQLSDTSRANTRFKNSGTTMHNNIKGRPKYFKSQVGYSVTLC